MRAEATACFEAAGIDVARPEEWAGARATLPRLSPVEGYDAVGGSVWQSLVRRTGSVEIDYMNGEIVLLGRLHHVATPVNARVTAIIRALSAGRSEPGSMTKAELLAATGLG